MKNVSRHLLWCDSSFLLNYEKANIAAYAKAGVPTSRVKQYEPFFTWVPKVMAQDIEEASLTQVIRDAKLRELLFDPKAKVAERGALDALHLFVEAGARVMIASHETPDALIAVIARAGLPGNVEQTALAPTTHRTRLIHEYVQAEGIERVFVLERDLPEEHVFKLVQKMADKLTLINVNCSPGRAERAVDDLVNAVEKEWLYDR